MVSFTLVGSNVVFFYQKYKKLRTIDPDYQFVAINCAEIPRDLIGCELSGYEEGAFTGAKKEGNKVNHLPNLFERQDYILVLGDYYVKRFFLQKWYM